MKRTAAVNQFVRLARICDEQGLYSYAEVFTQLMRRVASGDMFHEDMSGSWGQENDQPTAEDLASYYQMTNQSPIATQEVSTEELERADMQNRVTELLMKPTKNLSEIEEMQRLLHTLRGGTGDSYQQNPDNLRLRRILNHPEDMDGADLEESY